MQLYLRVSSGQPRLETTVGEPLGLGYRALRRQEIALAEGRVPIVFEYTTHALAKDLVDSDTSNARSMPSDSTAPLSPDHPFTHASPTLVPILYRNVRIAVRVPHAMSPGLSASISEEGMQLYLRVSSGQPRLETTVGEPLGLGYRALRRQEIALAEGRVPSVFEGTSELVEDDDIKEEDDEEDKEIDESSDSDSKSEDAEDEGPTAEDEDPTIRDEGDTQIKNQELRLHIAEERRTRLDLAEIVDSMRRGQEHRGDV
nr:hypothetical protein [Tanacetum cinerariifolium]